jgi:hypothetical protein
VCVRVRPFWRRKCYSLRWNICVTNDHGYVPLVVNTSRSCSNSRHITGFVTRLTRRVPLVEQELLTLPEQLTSPPVFSGVRVTRSLVLYVCFVDRCLSFCTFFFWPLCCLFFFDIRILIAPLVSSNSSLSRWSHSAHDCSRNIKCHEILGRYSCSYRSALSATAKIWSRLSTCMTMQDVTWLVFGKTLWIRITFVFFPERHYYRICRPLRQRQNQSEKLQDLRDILMHEWNDIPHTFIQRVIGSMRRRCEALVSARDGHTRYWTPYTSILHDNFCLSMICSDNDVEKFCWYCLICYAHMNLNYTIFVDISFLYVKNIDHQTLVSFLLLTSMYNCIIPYKCLFFSGAKCRDFFSQIGGFF